MEFGSDKVGNCPKIISTRCNWNLARTIFEISLEYFRGDAIGIWLKQGWELSQNIFACSKRRKELVKREE